MWRLLATSDVKASCLNVYDINTTRHVVPEDAQFKARVRHSNLSIQHYFSKFCRFSVIPSTFPVFPSPNSCYPKTGSSIIILHVLRHLFNLKFLCQLKLPMQLKATTSTLNIMFWQHINNIQTISQSQLNLHYFQNLVLITTCFGSPRHTIYKIHGRI
jgi:hypothetical protein